MWNEVARRVPHGTVGDARPLGLQVEHVVPGFHVLGAERGRGRIESVDKSISTNYKVFVSHSHAPFGEIEFVELDGAAEGVFRVFLLLVALSLFAPCKM